ncbi:MAG: hypothetical protein HOM21_12385, partial [Halobacteriovoraceae bacterium]|nr:hypothetical protein [Halobacteriovoraceae bacterium]
MSDHFDDDDKKDDGSVWTSYSDMFTTMAVIFLVMFVFALLRSGVSTVTAVKQKKNQEEILKGKIPSSVQNANNQKKEKLKKSIDEMDSYNELINSKMVELNQFAEKMGQHKVVINDLLKDQEEKEAAMVVVAEKLEIKDQQLKQNEEILADSKSRLEKTISEIQLKELQNQELSQKQEELKNQIEIQNSVFEQSKQVFQEQIAQKEEEKLNEIKAKENILEVVKKQHEELLTNKEAEKESIQKQLAEKQNKLEYVEQTNNQLIQTIEEKKLAVEESNSKINGLESNIAQMESEISSSKELLQKKEEKITNGQSELNNKIDEINQIQSKITQQEYEKKELQRQLVTINEEKSIQNEKLGVVARRLEDQELANQTLSQK